MSVIASNLIWILTLLVQVIIVVAALIVIPRGRKPTAAMSWLLLIALLPGLGILLFLLIGSFRLPTKRRAKQQQIDGMIRSRMDQDRRLPVVDSGPRWFQRVTQQNETLAALLASAGNTAELLYDYQESIDAMAAEIDTAEKFVHIEFYIVGWDDATRGFFAAMERAVARGVEVRLLADFIATRKIPGSKAMLAELDRIGVTRAWMLPVRPLHGEYQRPDLRNHRKIVVVDGRVGFIGSQNLIDRSYDSPKNIKRGLKWQDLMTRLTGPVVASVNTVFLSDWFLETGEDLADAAHVPADQLVATASADALLCQVVPSSPGYETENNLRLFLSLIYGATDKVILTSPYFVPDEAMMYAITTACQRGLEVQLFVSEIGDQFMVWHAQRSYYSELLKAGVRIFLFPEPYILHSKHFSIDDDIAVIGSSNMDIRSFSLNSEVSLLVHGRSFVAGMREVEQRYRDAGRELTLEEWQREPAHSTFFDGVMRLTSAIN